MNKQEAKEKLHNLTFAKMNTKPDKLHLADVMQFISQIDEPQKVVVPKCIVDKIKYCKENSGYSLFHAMDHCFQYKDSADWLEYNQELFAKAWLAYPNIKVEQEKMYIVKIPGLYNGDLGYSLIHEGFSLYDKVRNWNGIRYKHTKKELEEAGFGWVFDLEFAKEVGHAKID